MLCNFFLVKMTKKMSSNEETAIMLEASISKQDMEKKKDQDNKLVDIIRTICGALNSGNVKFQV